MVKKILRGLLIVFLLLVILLAGAVVYVDLHLRSGEEKLLQDFADTEGLEVAFRRTNLRIWKSFPQVSLTIDSLVIRDTLLPRDAPALLAVSHFETRLNLAALLRDTVSLESVQLTRGSLYLAADSSGTYNTGRLLNKSAEAAPTKYSFATPLISYDNSRIWLDDIAVTFLQPARDKRIELRVDSIRTTLQTLAEGAGVKMNTQMALHIGQLAFNTEKGAYLTDAPLSGYVEGVFGPEVYTFSPTPLQIGTQTVEFSAEINRTPGAISHLYFSNDSTDYELTQALMPAKLRARLSEFYATGHFPVKAHVLSTLQRGEDTEVRVELQLAGQDVRAKKYNFRKVFTKIAVVNRLDEADHGIPGSRKNMRIDFTELDGNWGDIHLSADHATVAVFGKDARLRSAMQFSGPTRAVSSWLQNEDFFFSGGHFRFDAKVDASLIDYVEMAATTDGRLRLEDLNVVYQPAGVSFPFREISLSKVGDDVAFHLQSQALETGFTFALDGKLDNLTPLLIDVPGGRLRTQVNLYAPRIDWTDFLAFFGEDGLVASDRDTTSAPPGNQAVKQTLLGLRETFQPDVEAHFDTVAYYDVFTLTDFGTGLHFADDTLVLERTSFQWAGSRLAFGARLDLGGREETPFSLDVATDHLNLNLLRPTLDYFGLRLPVGLETLPDDLHIRFAHAGIIDDSMGIKPGYNIGKLDFDDGRDGRFSGNMNYRPGTTGLATNFQLAGDPAFVNELFGAENFFFGTGRFAIDLAVDGMPADLPALILTSRMQLRIDSSRVTYRPAQVYAPIKTFTVDVDRGHATYALDLLNDASRRSVVVTGKLDQLTSFLYPGEDDVYQIEANISASLLHLSDITGFFGTVDPVPDSSVADTRQLLSASGGIFNSLRPELAVAIDSFYATDSTLLTNVHASLHLVDSTSLVLDRSGFTLGDGSVELAATYRLDEKTYSPFTADLYVDNMDVSRVAGEIIRFDSTLGTALGHAGGKVNLSGRLTGQLDENNERILYDRTKGSINYALTGLEFADWQPLLDLGKKIKMRRRFEHLRFAPLTGTLTIDSGRVLVPRTEIQSTALQLFVEGHYDLGGGPDFLVTIPLRNIGRGVLDAAPSPTGYAHAGWKVFLVTGTDEDGELKNKFRLGNRRYFKSRGQLAEWRRLRDKWRNERRTARKR